MLFEEAPVDVVPDDVNADPLVGVYVELDSRRGIAREYGSPIAWFKDPAGNILSVLEDS